MIDSMLPPRILFEQDFRRKVSLKTLQSTGLSAATGNVSPHSLNSDCHFVGALPKMAVRISKCARHNWNLGMLPGGEEGFCRRQRVRSVDSSLERLGEGVAN